MNGLAIAQEIASQLVSPRSDEELEWLMWNQTGWPSFFDGDPETIFRQQLRTALGLTEATHAD